MTCYLRYLSQVFKEAGIEVTAQNKREIDRIIHEIAGVNYKNCPATWKQVKTLISEDEENFVSMLKDSFKKSKDL